MTKLRLGMAVGGAVAALGLGGYLLLGDANRFRGPVQAELRKALGREVTLGEMGFGLLPLRLQVENFAIAEEAGLETGRPFAQAKRLAVGVAFWPLLQGETQVQSFVLERPVVEVVRKRDGEWNFSSLGGKQKETSGSVVRLERFTVEDGQIAYTNLQEGRARRVFDHVDVTLRDVILQDGETGPGTEGRPFAVEASLRLPGGGEKSLAWEGTATAGGAVEGKLRLREAPLSALEELVEEGSKGSLEAKLNGEVAVRRAVAGGAKAGGAGSKSQTQESQVQGEIGWQALTVNGRTLEVASKLQVDVGLDEGSGVATVRKLALQLGQTAFALAGSVGTKGAAEGKGGADGAGGARQLDLTLTTKESSIVDLLRISSALGGLSPNLRLKGQLSGMIRAQGTTEKPTLQGEVTITGAEVQDPTWQRPVRSERLRLLLTPERISTEPFRIESGDSSFGGQVQVSGYAGAAPQLQAEVKVPPSEMAELLRMAKAFGVKAANGVSGSGQVSLEVAASGPVRQSAQLQMRGKGSLRGVRLQSEGSEPVEIRSAQITFQNAAGSGQMLEATGLDATVQMGSVKDVALRGRVAVENFAKPRVNFQLETGTLDLTKGGTSGSGAGGSGAGETPEISAKGQLRVERLVLPKLQLENVQSQVEFAGGQLVLAPLSARAYEGSVTGSVRGNLKSQDFQTELQLKDVEAGKFLGAVSTVKNLTGKLSGTAQMALNVGGDANAMTKSAKGRIALALQPGRLQGIDILTELAKIAKFAGYAKEQTAFTNIVALQGTVDVQDGVLSSENLRLELDGAALNGRGNINLVTQSLAMKLTAVLSQAFSERAGGTKVGGWMVTAFANQKNELVIPTVLGGSFVKPTLLPDPQEFARLRVQAVTKEQVNQGVERFKEGMKEGLKEGVMSIFKKRQKGGEAAEKSGETKGAETKGAEPKGAAKQP